MLRRDALSPCLSPKEETLHTNFPASEHRNLFTGNCIVIFAVVTGKTLAEIIVARDCQSKSSHLT